MIIEINKTGINSIKEFSNSIIEIELPNILSYPYQYKNNIEYLLIKDMEYIVDINGNQVLNSKSNAFSKLCGHTLLMYDDTENIKKINYDKNRNIIYFNPYSIYKGCLNSVIDLNENDMDCGLDNEECNNVLNNNIRLTFRLKLKLTSDDIVKYDTNINSLIPLNSTDYIKYYLPTIFNWNIVNEKDNSELPTKRSKFNEYY